VYCVWLGLNLIVLALFKLLGHHSVLLHAERTGLDSCERQAQSPLAIVHYAGGRQGRSLRLVANVGFAPFSPRVRPAWFSQRFGGEAGSSAENPPIRRRLAGGSTRPEPERPGD
jgi:hypothetical protein